MHARRFAAVVGCAVIIAGGRQRVSPSPQADHHQHLFSPAIAAIAANVAPYLR
jgi:hypothetical protein